MFSGTLTIVFFSFSLMHTGPSLEVDEEKNGLRWMHVLRDGAQAQACKRKQGLLQGMQSFANSGKFLFEFAQIIVSK